MLGPAAAIFSALLVITGFAKLRRPQDTSRALSSLGLPGARWTGLALGVVEVTVGVWAIAGGERWILVGQGVLYTGFVVWVLLALSRGAPIESCGCLGTADTPPYWGHLALDALAGIVSVAAGIAATGSILTGSALESLTTLVLVAVGVFLSWVVIGDGARLRGAARP